MDFPERFSNLPEYAFPRLRALLDGIEPGGTPLLMSIGEPKHAFPAFVPEIIARHADEFGRYPPNEGTEGLLDAIGAWVLRRYDVRLNPSVQVMVLNGTREGLFAAGVALCPARKGGGQAVVAVPNPFYQVYAVAAATAGAETVFLPATEETGFLPDVAALPEETLKRLAMVYVCSPSNPQGAVASEEYWRALIGLAEEHDFQVMADECYSEIWRSAPPAGALEVAARMGAHPERVAIFHSLSKRSNLPGLRSGFVAGGPETIRRMRQLRAYAGAPLPLPLQHAAEAVWRDEAHVDENRRLYQRKYEIAARIFGNVPGFAVPEGGFFLWLPVEDGEDATRRLWRETGVKVLPGHYLAREVDGVTPGKDRIRVAMVAEEEEMERGLQAIRETLY